MRDDRDQPTAGPHDHTARFGAPDFEGMPIEVLRRYVKSASDAAERRSVQSWAAESPGRQWYLDAMRNLLERAPSESRSGTEAAWSRLAA
ncbi:MAG TPA: hypothetical protein VIR34_18270, partial [Gemmatimonadaceae bacterium]